MRLRIELERSSESGEWVAEIPELPGCLVVEPTEAEALLRVEALALRILADQLEHGERKPEDVAVSFETRAAA